MTKTTKKTIRRKTTKSIRPDVPYQLDMIGWLLGGTTANTRDALAAARAALALMDTCSGSRHDIMGEFEEYILTYANGHSERIDRIRAVDPGNVDGDLLCSFSGPAFLAG